MKKWIVWGILFALLHIVIFSLALYTDKLPARYGALAVLLTPVIFIYEFPAFIITKLLSIPINGEDKNFVLLAYSLGTILYFSIGAFIAYVRSLPYKKR